MCKAGANAGEEAGDTARARAGAGREAGEREQAGDGWLAGRERAFRLVFVRVGARPGREGGGSRARAGTTRCQAGGESEARGRGEADVWVLSGRKGKEKKKGEGKKS